MSSLETAHRAPGSAEASPPETASTTNGADAFRVSLDVFDGPFDLLLSLISQRELDITEVSLGLVTDDFIAYLSTLDGEDVTRLDQASEFLVVAATLLDLKIASLLPQGELVDAEDVALLEARDLLFARLLQYRAYKLATEWFAERLAAESQRHARQVPLDARYRGTGPELIWTLSPTDFAAIATLAFAPREIPSVALDHLHAPLVSIREQAAEVVSILRSGGVQSFRSLIAGISEPGVIVARFLAILELYRSDAVQFDQAEPLGELFIEWNGDNWNDETLATLGADYD